MKNFHMIANAAPVSIVMAEQSGRITFANREACFLFGYEHEELVGQEIELLVPGANQLADLTLRDPQSSSQRRIGGNRDVRGRRKDGSEFFVEVALSPVTTSEGPSVLVAVFDITERKKLMSQLEAANRELEGFSYSVSHDLRAPLRAIDGFCGMILKKHSSELDSEGRRLFGVVRRNVDKMGELIDALLEFSRLAREPLSRTRIDMTAMARGIMREFQELEPARTWEITIHPLAEAHGDTTLIRQVWVNLIGNACKYSSPRTHAVIEIGGRRQGNEEIYYVKDNGVGFDMRYYDKLFQVFQRLHKSSEFQGTGIGLALVHRIVSRHHGRVWGESKTDEGAVFSFALPI